MVQYRREYLNRLANNDSAGAAGVANEFQTRFGFKLSVAQQQVREFKKIRGTPRTNRIFDRLPPEARPFYAESVANAGQMVGVPKETTLNAFQKLEAPQARFASEQPVPSPFGYPQDPSVGPQGFGGFDANPFKWTQPMGDVGGGA